ncbi:MAG TPA: hypothetical protein DHU96_21920 [Actinobacteria bacterium]|nr:hypothetical protein [Actinomycetota bacterium]
MLISKPVPSRWIARARRRPAATRSSPGRARPGRRDRYGSWVGHAGIVWRRGAPGSACRGGLHAAALGHPGKTVSLRQYAGHPVVVNFFASWCGPCNKETPLLARFYRSGQAKVSIVGLDENDKTSSALRFVRKYGVRFPVGFDPAVRAGRAYGVEAIPQTFFLSASHHIVRHVYGALTLQELRAGTSQIARTRRAAGASSRAGT